MKALLIGLLFQQYETYVITASEVTQIYSNLKYVTKYAHQWYQCSYKTNFRWHYTFDSLNVDAMA